MVDGARSGTGGGNHMVLGGASITESASIRRPTCSRAGALLAAPSFAELPVFPAIHWSNQPGPRIDEARHDSLYEIEIAARPGAAPGVPPQFPWVRRPAVFRNMLVDVTGNTPPHRDLHRQALLADGPTGRPGLVEFRGFEMRRCRMSVAQQLLLRALTACSGASPGRRAGPLGQRRSTTAFCCRTSAGPTSSKCSPTLRRAGYDFDPVWFEAQRQFRLPVHGTIEAGAVSSWRSAMRSNRERARETGAIGGTVRYVDSSTERLQVKASGLTPGAT